MALIPKCKYCATAIEPDPTDPEDWVHSWSQDAQCRKMHSREMMDSYATPREEH